MPQGPYTPLDTARARSPGYTVHTMPGCTGYVHGMAAETPPYERPWGSLIKLASHKRVKIATFLANSLYKTPLKGGCHFYLFFRGFWAKDWYLLGPFHHIFS